MIILRGLMAWTLHSHAKITWLANAMLELEIYNTQFRADGRIMGFQVKFAGVCHGRAITVHDARGV